MIHSRLASSLAALLSTIALAGCPGSSGSGNETSSGGDLTPFRGEWEMVVSTAFPLDSIKTVTLGRKEYMENFANRGDIEVFFDLPDETITIELRRYTFNLDQPEADDVFSRLHLWAYTGSSTPKKPSDMDELDNCESAWQDACAVNLYYDGQAQPARAGADMRVHLPAAYREKVVIQTEDNTTEFLYPLRGDVTVHNLCGSADVKLSSGLADIHFCRELTPGPTCSAADITACETFMKDDGMGPYPAPWDSTCPCTAFGKLTVESTDPYAANIKIDMPSTVWAAVNLDNRKSGQTVAGPHCTAVVDPSICGANCVVSQSAETPWKATADLNFPGESATKGAGYSVSAISNGCEGVLYADGPDDYDPNAEKPAKEEDRGNITLCTDCLPQ